MSIASLTIDAIYENGQICLLEPLELEEGQRIKLTINLPEDKALKAAFGDTVRWPEPANESDAEIDAELDRISQLLADDKQVSDYIIEDREDRF